MENVESPTKNLSNSAGRNVLKELNNLDGAIKSPQKIYPTNDQTTPSKESVNPSKNLPDIVTNVHSDVGERENFVETTVIANRSFLNAAPLDVQSSDDESYVDCNSTFKNDPKVSEVNETIENVSEILDQTIQILEKLGPSDIVTQTQANEANSTVCLDNKEKFNKAFVSEANSSAENSTIGFTEDLSESASVENLATAFQHLAVLDQPVSNDTSIAPSLAAGIEIASHTSGSTEIADQYVDDSPSLQEETVQDTEAIQLNRTVDIISAVDREQEIDVKLNDNQIATVESDATPFVSPEIASSLDITNIQCVTDVSDRQVDVPVVTHLEQQAYAEAAEHLSTVDVEPSNLNRTISLDTVETTFIVTNHRSDRTVVLEKNSSIIDQATDTEIEPQNKSENVELPNSNQIEKTREFKNNQTISVDSLDVDTRNCSLDSIEVEKLVDQPPSTSKDEILTNAITDELFKNEKCPALSELFAMPDQSSNKLNESSNNGRSSIDRLIRRDTFDVNSEQTDVALASGNVDNAVKSDFKTPMLPNSVFPNMSKQQIPADDNSFMVLNSDDFDFLQSRGGSSVGPKEGRNSLLLRFDPLLKTPGVKTHFNPAVPRVAESAEAEHSFSDTAPIPEFYSHNSGENSSDEQKNSTTKSPVTNDAAMSVGLVHDSNNMDGEAYVNAIEGERTEDKHIDGVPLTDKKKKFEYTDGNIQKKMEEYETTQDILLKRISEKEKTLSKNCAIIETYEKALAELVVEKEKLTETYEIMNERLRQERDTHKNHLMSLETTFSDLHTKYERSKEFTVKLQERLDALNEEKAMIDELLKQQEARYEKMKHHALEQLESANATLEDQARNFSKENSKLNAQLKMEEVSRNTIQEQLLQKTKENHELVKICDELIGGQKS